MLSCTFHAPRRFHPGHSFLARWLRRRTSDRLRAEALQLLVVTLIALFLLFLHLVSGALLAERALPRVGGVPAYWLVQAALVGLTLATCGIGFRPALTVTCQADAVRIVQGQRTCTLPRAAIASIQRITAQRFHRHERRYAATQPFIGVLRKNVLLLRVADGSAVVIGLPLSELDALQACLETATTPERTENAFVEARTAEQKPSDTGE